MQKNTSFCYPSKVEPCPLQHLEDFESRIYEVTIENDIEKLKKYSFLYIYVIFIG